MTEPYSRQTYILERFDDGGWAVLEREDRVTFAVPRFWLPSAAAEGDVIVVEALPESGRATGSTLDLYIDEHETRRRREAARAKRESLPKGPDGDLSL